MQSGPVRVVLIIVGVIAIVVGAVWIGQGLGYIPGSFMTGSQLWFIIGLVVAIVGVVLLVLGIRGRGSGRTR